MIIHVALLLAVPASTGSDWRDGPGQFHYRWPAEINAHPGLRARLSREMVRYSRDAHRYIANEQPSGFYYHKRWRLAGTSDRLVSLTAEIDIFMGWLHDDVTYEALL
jgi:hypothetical protein